MLKKRLQRDCKDPLDFSFSNFECLALNTPSQASSSLREPRGTDLDPQAVRPTGAYLSTAMAVSVKTET